MNSSANQGRVPRSAFSEIVLGLSSETRRSLKGIDIMKHPIGYGIAMDKRRKRWLRRVLDWAVEHFWGDWPKT